MSTAVDYRQVSAKYYNEAYATKEDLDDLQFYIDMAKANCGPVLELACGTGRILLPSRLFRGESSLSTGPHGILASHRLAEVPGLGVDYAAGRVLSHDRLGGVAPSL
jgi:hypothetical protein